MRPLSLDGESRSLAKFFYSPYLVPFLFLLFHYGVFTGIEGFSHDAGDGLAAFKFFSFPPRYWNWMENTGQPFWLDMAWFRVQDPLWWPLLALCKALPLGTLAAFHTFLLLRIAVLGVGIGLLFRDFGARGMARQLGVALALFGSFGANLFAQFGLFDLGFTFVFGLYFFRRRSWWALTAVFVSATQSYTALLLFPFALVAALRYHRVLRAHWREVGTGLVVVSLAAASSFVAVREEGLLPILRSLRYHSTVDETGRNLTRGSDFGKSVFDKAALDSTKTCHTEKFCSESSWSWLVDLFSPKQDGKHYASYLTVTGLLAALLGLILMPWRGRVAVGVFALLSFLLSLGSKTPLWGLTQTLFPFLYVVRHTHHLMSLTVLALCFAAAMALTQIPNRRLVAFLALVAVLELFAFDRWTAFRVRTEPSTALKELVRTPLPQTFMTREFRPAFRHPSPRSGWATLSGIPTALENAPEGNQPRHFGAVTSFYWESYVRARLSKKEPDLRRAFGVRPNPVVSVSPGMVPVPLNWIGENLEAEIASGTSAYFSVPFDAVAEVRVNGQTAAFEKAQGFGVSVPLGNGPHKVELIPKLGTRNAVFGLFYGSYCLWFAWAFAQGFLSARARTMPEKNGLLAMT